MSKCVCGTTNQGEWKFCANCGAKNQPAQPTGGSFCSGCGVNQSSPNWKFCANCGAKNAGAFSSGGEKGFGSGIITRPDTRESTTYANLDLRKRQIGGLDEDLARKRDASYDLGLEAACRQWMQEKTGKSVEGDLHAFLKDGVFLCTLANSLKPGSTTQPKQSKMPFHQMENINNFLKFATSAGVASLSLFQTVDLYENKNMGQVILCLSQLSRVYP